MNRTYQPISRGTAGTSLTKARHAICRAQMRPVVGQCQWNKSARTGCLA
ncbi:MAG TPA: hypothetical protein VMI53_02450 [Opitutaceae bacterium]|nr:hypothetical protein [Opitutaceae bacterium]